MILGPKRMSLHGQGLHRSSERETDHSDGLFIRMINSSIDVAGKGGLHRRRVAGFFKRPQLEAASAAWQRCHDTV